MTRIRHKNSANPTEPGKYFYVGNGQFPDSFNIYLILETSQAICKIN